MTQERGSDLGQAIRRVLVELFVPAIGFGLGVGLATGQLGASLVTGLAISGTICILYRLDRAFLHPHLEKLSRDWVHLGLELTFSLLEHVLGGLLALLVCGHLFGLRLVPSAAWMLLGGMVVVVPVIHGTEVAVRIYRQLKERERQEEQLRALATQAELAALKAQINPHFLFNTLNTIAQLIHTDSARAEETVERLAEMFRYVLAGSERELVPLEEELTFLEGYLEIERARFGERLRVTQEVAPDALDVLVPSLILQPLVENAVRHGRGNDGSIDLALRVGLTADEVIITVADHGPGMPPSFKLGEAPGHGLRNVDERLRKAYGAAYGLEIAADQPQGTVATIRIPMRERI
jgi:signal transduction histidine kinase